MVNLDTLFERIDCIDGIDIQGILDFIDEMSQGTTNEWYTAEKRERYLALDFSQAISITENSSRAKIRKSLIDNRIRNLAPAVSNAVDYF